LKARFELDFEAGSGIGLYHPCITMKRIAAGMSEPLVKFVPMWFEGWRLVNAGLGG
jgi:hypothetical protein